MILDKTKGKTPRALLYHDFINHATFMRLELKNFNP
ncbi:hypothetical protein H500_06370 [Helicobacter pylori CG-IMSS-2012]|nr:hypothetical protein H500_06370 [Helicobacter pylori CG-IMSS-2012]